MTRESHVPIPLSPPLRPFCENDAPVVARINDAASSGIVARVWQEKAGIDGDHWEFGRRRQIERMESGQIMVVADSGNGAEAALIGCPIGPEPESAEGVPPVFLPLVELENLALGSWYLNIIGTVPEARRKGHADRLLNLAEQIAAALGREEINLIVSDANRPARALYAKHGYRERSQRPMTKQGHGADMPGDQWLPLGKNLAPATPR